MGLNRRKRLLYFGKCSAAAGHYPAPVPGIGDAVGRVARVRSSNSAQQVQEGSPPQQASADGHERNNTDGPGQRWQLGAAGPHRVCTHT